VAHGDLETCLSSSWLSAAGKLMPVALSDDVFNLRPEYENLMESLGTRILPIASGETVGCFPQTLEKTLDGLDSKLTNKFFVSTQLTPLNVATAYTTVGQEIKAQLENLKVSSCNPILLSYE